MLTLYHNGSSYPLQIDDYYVRQLVSGLDEVIFEISVHDPAYMMLQEEEQITDRAGQVYLVKQIDAGSTRAKVICQLDLDAWKRTMHVGYNSGSHTCYEILSAVAPEGWSVEDFAHYMQQRTIEGDYTPFEICEACRDVFRVYVRWDNHAKIVYIYPQSIGEPVGAFATRELNLKEINYKGKSTDFATRLYPYGKDGLTIEGAIINGEPYPLAYVEDNSYSDKVISAYWKDERYTVAQNLYDDAKARLAEMAKPVRTYDCSIVDLQATNPEKYGTLRFDLLTVAMLVDDTKGTSINYQVIERHEFPYYPEKNEVIFDSAPQQITNSIIRIADAIDNPNSTFQQIMNAEIGLATDWLTNSDSHIYIKRDSAGNWQELFFLDGTEDVEQATRVMRLNSSGLGFSINGVNGPFRNAFVFDPELGGHLVADFITAGILTANVIKAGILQDAQGLNTINMETGEIHLNLTAADVGAVSPQELTTQLTVLNGQITSEIEETRTEIETYYFCPPNQRSWWRLNKYADLLSFAQNEDGSWYVDLDGTSFSSYTSDAYIWQALEFEGSGSFTFTVKFEILGEVPDITTQNLALVAYTSDSDGVRYITGLRVSATDGVVSVTGTGSTTVTPDENGVYRWDSSKRISKSGTNDRFALYFIPGCIVRYELQYVEMTTTQANYYTSTQSVVSQKLDQLELAVEQLSQQASADYIPSTYLDPEMEDWYVSPGDPIQIVTYQGADAVELDGTDVTQTNWQYDILRIPLAQVGTYTFQFSAWTETAFTPASGELIARFYYCCANPAEEVQPSVPVAVISPATFAISARQSAAGTEVIYSGQITIPTETTVTYNGTQYTAPTQLMSRDANYGTFGLEFYFAPGIKRYIRSLSLYGSASDYARSVLSIASDMIQQEVTRASSAEGNLQAQITVNADAISQRVEKNGVISAINQSAESVSIEASKINLSGYVTIAGLGSSGNVAVDGSRITNGTVATAKIADSAVNAAKIASNAVTSAKVADANITTVKIANGAITAGKVAANAITADKIAANAVTAGKIAAGAITAGKIAANAITSDKIAANAITGKTISGGTIKQTVSGASTGGWSPSTNGTQAEIKNGIVKCGQVNINGGSNLLAEGSDDNGYRGIKCTGHFSTVGTIWCGDGSHNRNEMLDVRGGIWCNRIYSLEGGGWLSDRREKHNIVDIPKDKAESFILGLKPVSYELNARPGVVHHGFIAQDVQEVAYDDWDIVSEQEDMRSHEVTLALSYTDFIADMVSVIQTQARKIEELERRINSITEDDGK